MKLTTLLFITLISALVVLSSSNKNFMRKNKHSDESEPINISAFPTSTGNYKIDGNKVDPTTKVADPTKTTPEKVDANTKVADSTKTTPEKVNPERKKQNENKKTETVREDKATPTTNETLNATDLSKVAVDDSNKVNTNDKNKVDSTPATEKGDEKNLTKSSDNNNNTNSRKKLRRSKNKNNQVTGNATGESIDNSTKKKPEKNKPEKNKPEENKPEENNPEENNPGKNKLEKKKKP